MPDRRPNILELAGDYAAWSNFALRKVRVFGRLWATSEHAFQAAKFFHTDPEQVERIAAARTPGEAKGLGRDRSRRMRSGWDDLVAPSTMTLIVLRKFEQHADLGMQLLASEALIVEGNGHGDRIWGAVWERQTYTSIREGERVWAREQDGGGHEVGRLIGRNQLGVSLMLVRDAMRGNALL